jgi:hypothetical protein
VTGARALDAGDYIQRTEPVFAKEGFYEREVGAPRGNYGNIAHVFSTYESFHSLSDKKPFMRGINSFQLLNDGKRWWVITISGRAKRRKTPIPKKYLNRLESEK